MSDKETQITKNQHMVAQLVQREFSEDKVNVLAIREIRIPGKDKDYTNRIKYEIGERAIERTISADSCYEIAGKEINELENDFMIKEDIYKKILENLKSKASEAFLKERVKSRKEIEREFRNLINVEVMKYLLCFYYRTTYYVFSGIKPSEKEDFF